MRLYSAILLLFLFFAASIAEADQDLFFDLVTQAENQYRSLEEKALKGSDWTVYRSFRAVISNLKKDQFSDLSESLEELKFVAGSRGYTDLPDYSMELLKNASNIKDPFKSKFLIEKAVLLSPTDSRVAFTAATFYKITGIKQAIGLLFKAIGNITTQPVFLANIILNMVVVFLVSITISVFFAYFIQIIRNSNSIREALFPFLLWKYRGILSVIALLAIYILPFFGGALIVISIWGLCLGLILGRRYLFISGVVCMLWGGLLPTISKVAYNVNDPSSKVFEDLNLSRFSPKSEKYLQKRLVENPNDGAALFFLGQTFRLKGFNDSAKTLFSRVRDLAVVESDLKKVSQANLGVIAFDNGKYKKALELLTEAESQGMKGFEIYYNLAIANLLALNTDEYAKYYNLAKDIAPGRISQIVSDKYLSPKAILIPVPGRVMLKPLFNPILSLDPLKLSTVNQKFSNASSILSGGLSSNLTLVLGFLLCIVCASLKSNKLPESMTSRVWVFFPFGRYLASNQAIFGIIGLSFLISVLILGPSGPLNIYSNFSSFENLYRDFLILIFLVLMLFQGLSFYTIRGGSNE